MLRLLELLAILSVVEVTLFFGTAAILCYFNILPREWMFKNDRHSTNI